MAEPLTYEFDNELESLLKLQNMDKTVQKLIRTVLLKARSRLSQQTRAAIGNDPRQAYRAVRSSVYKRILGGNLSILNGKSRSVQKMEYNKPRTLQPGQRGGNRIKPSQRTHDLDSYYGKDRGFVLRFLNGGTTDRTSKYGYRGAISARGFFMSNAQSDMEQAMQELCQLIDEEYNNIFRK